MRLIDADALGIGKCNPSVFENKGYADGWNMAICVIENAPTIDAEPVRHGDWVKNIPEDIVIYCDQCLMPQDAVCNYCPQCGAKMDLSD